METHAWDNTKMIQFDSSGAVDNTVKAKTRNDTKKRNDLKYMRKKGRRISHKKEEARKEKQKVMYGGKKLYGKLKRQYHNLKKAGKEEEAKEIKQKISRCVISTKHSHSKRRVVDRKGKRCDHE